MSKKNRHKWKRVSANLFVCENNCGFQRTIVYENIYPRYVYYKFGYPYFRSPDCINKNINQQTLNYEKQKQGKLF